MYRKLSSVSSEIYNEYSWASPTVNQNIYRNQVERGKKYQFKQKKEKKKNQVQSNSNILKLGTQTDKYLSCPFILH